MLQKVLLVRQLGSYGFPPQSKKKDNLWLYFTIATLCLAICGFILHNVLSLTVAPSFLPVVTLFLSCNLLLYLTVYFIICNMMSHDVFITIVNISSNIAILTLYRKMWLYLSQCDFISQNVTLFKTNSCDVISFLTIVTFSQCDCIKMWLLVTWLYLRS